MIGNKRSFWGTLLSVLIITTTAATAAFGAHVTLRWDANYPAPEGYRVFARQNGASYNYNTPIWEDTLTECTLIGLTEGTTYHFVVRAYDGNQESADSQEVSFTAGAVGANQAPTADAGTNQTVYEGAMVTLDGTASSDSDSSIAAYQWQQTGGPRVSLHNASAAAATFSAPIVGLAGGTLTFRLTVTDDEGSSDTDTLKVGVLKSYSTDVDGDNVPDVLDRFPNDAREWADNDSDGIGDNQDTDDDNDGMSDSWEATYGLDPLVNDANEDADGDGVSNFEEFQAHSDPTAVPGNTVPDAPAIDQALPTESVALTPVLVTGAYFDVDLDDHVQSQWQISTESDFAPLILNDTSTTQLTAYSVGPMVLEVDTVYYWRVRFMDARHGASDWSETATFTTLAVENSDDTDINGIPDDQEVLDPSADVNENGIPDNQEDNIMNLNTVEGQAVVGVETVSAGATLVSIKSIPSDSISDKSVKLGFGLIGFRLYLKSGVTTASVKISFDKRVAKDAKLYKYMADSGWQVYDHAVFTPERKSVILMLEDGGVGDEDGVKNGVIVDPSGIAYQESDYAALSTNTGVSSGSGGGCFISTTSNSAILIENSQYHQISLVAFILVFLGSISAIIFSLHNNLFIK